MAEAPESFATTDGTNEPANLQGSHGSSHSRSSAEIHDRTGLYLAVIALIISALALGMVIMQNANFDAIANARIQAAVAQAEARTQAQFATQMAQAQATAREARTEALVTKDKLEELRDALNAKGMNLPKLDGH